MEKETGELEEGRGGAHSTSAIKGKSRRVITDVTVASSHYFILCFLAMNKRSKRQMICKILAGPQRS
jgi:hypothetical protein